MRIYDGADGPAVVDLVVAASMFTREEAAFLTRGVLDDADSGSTCLVDDAGDGRGLASVVLYRPEEAAERAFDLTMLAVRPDLQGGGRGAALVRHVERDLSARGQRLLLVRTSSRPPYERARALYRRLGFSEHTCVSDYWSNGDDLVLFSKQLNDQPINQP